MNRIINFLHFVFLIRIEFFPSLRISMGGEGGGGAGGSRSRWAAESCALYGAAATSAAPPARSQPAEGQEGGTRLRRARTTQALPAARAS